MTPISSLSLCSFNSGLRPRILASVLFLSHFASYAQPSHSIEGQAIVTDILKSLHDILGELIALPVSYTRPEERSIAFQHLTRLCREAL